MTGLVPAQRCLDVLEALAEHSEGLPLTALADALGVPKSATHRLLALLVHRGYACQDESSGRYRLTLRLTGIGFRFLAGTSLSEVCQPVLDRLAARTGELARMAVVDQNGLTWVAKAQGARSGLRYDPDMGRDVVLHATATGKAWLSTLPPDDALSLVQARGFSVPDRFGPRVVRTLAALKRELDLTRERGFGVAEEEGEPGTAAIAAVIRRGSLAWRSGGRDGQHRRTGCKADGRKTRTVRQGRSDRGRGALHALADANSACRIHCPAEGRGMTMPAPTTRSVGSASRLAFLGRRLGALAAFLLFFAVWEFGVRLFGVKEYLLPAPSVVVAALAQNFPKVLESAFVTTKEILAGYALAVAVSVPLALSIAYSKFMEETVYPVIVFLQIVPKIAIAPLFLIWFGFGFTPKLLLVFLLSFFPIIVSSIAGFKSVDPDIMDFARTTGAGSWRLFAKIRLPQALPGHLHRSQGRSRVVRNGRGGGRVRRLRPRPRLPAAPIQRRPEHPDGLRNDPRAERDRPRRLLCGRARRSG